DHFKRYNDEYGHLAGDTTLKQVADHLKGSLRRVDIIARYGGEEFMIVSPETRSEGALDVAERIRSGIARQNFKIYNQQTRVTVSIGVTLFPDDLRETMSSDEAAKVAFELIRHADRALYRAKEEGRNRVVMFRDL
ncbi:MAG: GGDEF domain-containing protein, partial [Candidatus Omnitrophica bacterium]|nr:GGDEF domain-containing protein [Candidatus Omnitrophota bacterium]